ncbi:MAG TPA: Wzz/FepE/Etk N-terminal domain-containing protein [Gaiellaceae bacterium]|nr:Wzz/FepE/Etk N-terminal domain-containing protein [Gaiellaceae bacterium]
MSEQPPLRRYLEVLGRQAWLIGAIVALAVATALLVTTLQTPVYRASMGIVVGQGGGVFQPGFGGNVEPFTLTLSNLLRTNVVAERVTNNLNLDKPPDQLLSDMRVRSKPASSVLEVSYDSTDKESAVAVLNEVGRVFIDLVDEKLGANPSSPGRRSEDTEITARVFDPAHLESEPVSPRPMRTLGFAGMLGLLIAITLVFVRDSLDDRIRRPKDAEEWFGAPVIGTLPAHLPADRVTAVPTDRRTHEAFEALRLLCAKLEFSNVPVSGPAIVITSAQETEGKSSVAANVSIMLATAGRDVVCVGADLYRPTLHDFFDLPEDAPGLIDVLQRRAQLADVFQTVNLTGLAAGGGPTPTAISTARREGRSDGAAPASPRGRLRVITAGRVEPNAIRLLDEHRIAGLVNGLRESADYAIFDSPPVLFVGDAYPLLLAADSVIVVARSGRTTQGNAEAVRATLESLEVQRVGLILTDSLERVDSLYGARAYSGLEVAPRHQKSGRR